MIIGSHNTMTYQKPLKWYYKPFMWMARCQNKDIGTQYRDYNVRVFDIRVYFEDNRWYTKHGFVVFPCNVYNLFSIINDAKDCWVQLVLEITKEDIKEENKFVQLCAEVEKLYPNIRFIGGVRKYDWKCLYDFKNKLSINGKFSSSPKNPKFIGIFPKLYSILFNKKFYKEPIEEDCLMLDFINIK